MPQTKFMAIIPQTVQPGDKIRIKGTVTTGAEQFSINFANDRCANPDNITYHFKWRLSDNAIIENYKQNGVWIDHIENLYNGLDGRLENGSGFALEFAFQDEGVYVYDADGHNRITFYEITFSMSDIEAIQVWGDVEKIQELSFVYQ